MSAKNLDLQVSCGRKIVRFYLKNVNEIG